VQVFSLSGSFRRKMGGAGRDPGRLLHPAGVAADRHGNVFVADRDNRRVAMFDRAGRHIAAVLAPPPPAGTCSGGGGGGDVRPVDVAVTAQTRLVVLVAGVEGADAPAEVRVYRLRCSLPPPDVRSVPEILSTVRALRAPAAVSPLAPAAPAAAADDDDNDDEGDDGRAGRKVRFRLPASQRPRCASSEGGVETTAGEDSDHGPKPSSQVCVIV